MKNVGLAWPTSSNNNTFHWHIYYNKPLTRYFPINYMIMAKKIEIKSDKNVKRMWWRQGCGVNRRVARWRERERARAFRESHQHHKMGNVQVSKTSYISFLFSLLSVYFTTDNGSGCYSLIYGCRKYRLHKNTLLIKYAKIRKRVFSVTFWCYISMFWHFSNTFIIKVSKRFFFYIKIEIHIQMLYLV